MPTPSFDSAQDVPLLTTKLYIPPVRPELVSRPRLIEQLNAGLHRKLTLISAPAGFGKTTLLSEWVAGCGRAVAWVSLERFGDLQRLVYDEPPADGDRHVVLDPVEVGKTHRLVSDERRALPPDGDLLRFARRR